MKSLLSTRMCIPQLNGREQVTFADAFRKGSRVLDDGRRVIDTKLGAMAESYIVHGDDASMGGQPVSWKLSASEKKVALAALKTLRSEVQGGSFLKNQKSLQITISQGPMTGKKVTVPTSNVVGVIDDLFKDPSKITEGYNSGNRRFLARLFAIAALAILGADYQGSSTSKAVLASFATSPAVVKPYANECERLLHNVFLNERRDAEAADLDYRDILSAATRLVKAGASQKQLRDNFKDGTGQKVSEIMDLEGLFPQLKIVERLLLEKDAPGFIPWGPCHQTPMRKLRQLVEYPDGKKKVDDVNVAKRSVREQKAAAKDPKVIDAATAYFADPKAGKGNKAPIAKKDKIESAAKASQVDLISESLMAVLENNVGSFVQTKNDKADQLNIATSAVAAGKTLAPAIVIDGTTVTTANVKAMLKQIKALKAKIVKLEKAVSTQTKKGRGRKSG